MPLGKAFCCVTHCVPVDRKTGVRYASFPQPSKKPELFNLWLKNIGNPRLFALQPVEVHKKFKVCSMHFTAEMLQPNPYYGSNKAVVKPGAYPTLRLNVDIPTDATRPLIVEPFTTQPGPSNLHTQTLTPTPSPSTTHKHTHSSIPSTSYKHTETLTPTLKPSTTHTYPLKTPRQGKERKESLYEEINTSRTALMSPVKKHFNFRVKALKRSQKALRKLNDSLKKAAKNRSMNSLEEAAPNLNSQTRRFLMSIIRHGKKRLRSRHFTEDERLIALSLYKQGPVAYRLMTRYFALPSLSSLRRTLSDIKLELGVNANSELIQQIRLVAAELVDEQRYCVLLFGEMPLQSHLSYDTKNDQIRGFENYGTLQRPVIADHALVFMARGIFHRWKQPIAFMFTGAGGATTPDLVRCIKEVLDSLATTDLKVVATICHQGSTNVAAINELKRQTRADCIRTGKEFRPESFIRNGKEIVCLFDPPHMLKYMRNNLVTKDILFTLDGTRYKASWNDIQAFYKYDKDMYTRCEALTDQHVVPTRIKKMSVQHAAQVFSNRVSISMLNLLRECTPERHKMGKTAEGTAKFVGFMDKLFDSVNCTGESNIRKPLKNYLSDTSGHVEFWDEAIATLRSMQFVERSGKYARPPAWLRNWVVTINGFRYLMKSLKQSGFEKLRLKSLNQDPLENFFGGIQRQGGECINPTSASFVSLFKTSCVNNMMSVHSKSANCMTDDDQAFTNLKHFVRSTTVQYKIEEPIMSALIPVPDARCRYAYVARCVGRSLLRLPNIRNCHNCFKLLTTNDKLPERTPSRDDAQFRPSIQLLTAYRFITHIVCTLLPKVCHQKSVKQIICRHVMHHVDLTFLMCGVHDISKTFVSYSVKFIIFLWCKRINRLLTGRGTRSRPDMMDPIQKAATVKYNSKQYYSRKDTEKG